MQIDTAQMTIARAAGVLETAIRRWSAPLAEQWPAISRSARGAARNERWALLVRTRDAHARRFGARVAVRRGSDAETALRILIGEDNARSSIVLVDAFDDVEQQLDSRVVDCCFGSMEELERLAEASAGALMLSRRRNA